MIKLLKSTRTKQTGVAGKLLRQVLIWFLFFVLVLATGAFLLRYNIAQQLDRLAVQLKSPSPKTEIANILLELDAAENAFQQAALYDRPGELENYRQQLGAVFLRMDVLLRKYQTDSTRHFRDTRKNISGSLQQKLRLSREVLQIKRTFDSLLAATITSMGIGEPAVVLPAYRVRSSHEKTDTSASFRSGAQRGLLRRLKDAVTNKNQAVTKVLIIRREKQLKDSIFQAVNRRNRVAMGKLLSSLNQQRQALLQSNKQLIAANNTLVSQLRRVLQTLNDIEFSEWLADRNLTFSRYQLAAGQMDTFTGITMLLVLLFVILLIFYIQKTDKAENNYLRENERAVALANQKSELLATVSHEVRNPLTAIMGSIYMLEKTGLNEEQQKKVTAINQASALLIESINNILDVGKMEYGQDVVLNETVFIPVDEIRQTTAAVTYMAENKGLSLTVAFIGDEQGMVRGDPFRLKQVMMNLLSNAIKYTDKGGVSIDVTFSQPGGQAAVLQVAISDTGPGINKEQQARLFDRYYQAATGTGKPGTGLGLYICKQLITRQKGTIWVESVPGKGSTFRFRLPYVPAQP